MNKKLYIFGGLTYLILGMVVFYLNFISQVELLKDHYPVFSKEKDSYILTKKKPSYWTPLSQISKEAKFAIVISEDWAFFDHEGIDVNQIKIVIKESLKNHELTRGASTISQQVLKNAFLSNERSIFRKMKEFLLVREFENKFTKNEILEIYLNLIQLGDKVYGIKKGSQYYFNKNPFELDAKEGAFLAMLLPSPIRYAQSFKDKELTSFARERIENILIKLKQAKIITETQRNEYSNEKLNFEAKYASDYSEFTPLEKNELDFEIEQGLN